MCSSRGPGFIGLDGAPQKITGKERAKMKNYWDFDALKLSWILRCILLSWNWFLGDTFQETLPWMERTWDTPLVALVPNPKIDSTWAIWSVSLLVLNVGNGGMIAISHAITIYQQSSQPVPSIPIQSQPVPSIPTKKYTPESAVIS